MQATGFVRFVARDRSKDEGAPAQVETQSITKPLQSACFITIGT
jgi:hypothetical protein